MRPASSAWATKPKAKRAGTKTGRDFMDGEYKMGGRHHAHLSMQRGMGEHRDRASSLPWGRAPHQRPKMLGNAERTLMLENNQERVNLAQSSLAPGHPALGSLPTRSG